MSFLATVNLPEAAAHRLAEALADDERLGGAAVDLTATESGWQVAVHLPERPDTTQTAALADGMAAAGASGAAFAIVELPDADWVRTSLTALAPVRAGRFLVHGSHDRDRVLPNDRAIEIEAALAFGTGHHGTTAGCLLAIDRISRSRRIRNALDVGTGTGVLAIAIAKASNARVTASDIDPVAVGVARERVRANGVASRVHTIVADGLAARAIRNDAPYDLIVANILAGPLVALAPAIHRALAPGGTVILSGLLTTQARRVAAIYRTQGLARVGQIAIGEWATLILRRVYRVAEDRPAGAGRAQN